MKRAASLLLGLALICMVAGPVKAQILLGKGRSTVSGSRRTFLNGAPRSLTIAAIGIAVGLSFGCANPHSKPPPEAPPVEKQSAPGQAKPEPSKQRRRTRPLRRGEMYAGLPGLAAGLDS